MTSDNFTAIILPQAENDITDILDYIAHCLNNPTAARNLWTDIKEAVARASMFPYAMPLVKNDKLTMGTAYRRIDVNNYVIIYKVVEDAKQIRIFAVLYGPSNVITTILNRV